MACGGRARGGNNGGNRSNENSFSVLDNTDRVHEDSNNAFYLSNGDHPGLGLVSNSLTGSNYNSWHQSMIIALIAKNKFGFVDGSISKPEIGDNLYHFWSRCNNMVMSWILNAVSEDTSDSIMYIHDARNMWIDLHDRFN
ncbi:hypothetical protein UlMin_020829 [Ulmus minor]